MSNEFRTRLDLSLISGEPIMEDENGEGCLLSLPGNALNHGTYNCSVPIDAIVSDDGAAASLAVGDAGSGWLHGTGPHNFQLEVTGGSAIVLNLTGVRVRLAQVSVELAT